MKLAVTEDRLSRHSAESLSFMDTEDMLRLKVKLLTAGARLPEGVSSGRRGGAGPVRGRYFVLPSGRSCGIPIRRGAEAERFGSAPLEPTEDPTIWLYDSSVELRMIEKPDFLGLTTEDGLPYSQIALLHCTDCLATTVYQSCRYWDEGTQCAFCTIPTSLEGGDTILDKSPSHIAEVVDSAEKRGIIRHVLLTTGTPEGEDMGTTRMVNIIREIRKSSEIPIGVQFEAPHDISLIDEVVQAGASAIGIHIESADEAVREKMCPGKHQHASRDLYIRAWKHAVGLLGRGNVSTFLLHGLGEDTQLTMNFIDEIAEIGVMPILAPVRPAPGSHLANYIPSYVGDLDGSLRTYKNLGNALYKWGLNPDSSVAGCQSCGGCTPIHEAYDWAASL
ncbi:MAG: radical SAM protein [Candidatus Thorarchaeota archaeon]|nr:MAG: radical SAM protein [Candidatus Thorarchaeota archaeon]